jgi:hypothetical protein
VLLVLDKSEDEPAVAEIDLCPVQTGGTGRQEDSPASQLRTAGAAVAGALAQGHRSAGRGEHRPTAKGATIRGGFVIATYSSMWNLPGARWSWLVLHLRRADSCD